MPSFNIEKATLSDNTQAGQRGIQPCHKSLEKLKEQI